MGPALNAQSKWGGIRESVSPSCGGDGGPDPVTFLYWLRAGEKVFLLTGPTAYRLLREAGGAKRDQVSSPVSSSL
jgi:hypothetical protein